MGDMSWPAERMAKFIASTPRYLRMLVDQGVVPKEERGRYDPFKVTPAYIKWLRDRKPESASLAESESQTRQGLNKRRDENLRIQNETLRRERVPVVDLIRVNEMVHGDIAARLKARVGQTLDQHTLNDILAELREAGENVWQVIRGEKPDMIAEPDEAEAAKKKG